MCQALAYNIHLCSLMGVVGPVHGSAWGGVVVEFTPRQSDDMVTEGKK